MVNIVPDNLSLYESDVKAIQALIGDKLSFAIAGGRSLAYIRKEYITTGQDVDLWFFSAQERDEAIQAISSKYKPSYISENAITFSIPELYENVIKIQVIMRISENVHTLLNSFDISATKSAFLYTPGKAVEIATLPEFEKTIHNKLLEISEVTEITFIRLKKYTNRLLYLSDNTIGMLLKYTGLLYSTMGEMHLHNPTRYDQFYAE